MTGRNLKAVLAASAAFSFLAPLASASVAPAIKTRLSRDV